MQTDTPQLAVSREFDAPRALVYTAFTDPGHLSAWWGPAGSSVDAESIECDVRPGGFQQWTELAAGDPDLRVRVRIDLSDAIDGELLEGVMHVSGRLNGGIAPFATRFRIEFHEAAGGRTRLEIRQWLPAALVGPSRQGWQEALAKLDTVLASTTAV